VPGSWALLAALFKGEPDAIRELLEQVCDGHRACSDHERSK
jgi:hypothetical protein